jgi:molybdenum cofactor cytidylyltransferase
MGSTGAVILAAGGSTRMGQPKQLLPFQGQPLLRHIASRVLESACRPVIVVLGRDADACRDALAGLPVICVDNPDWPTGMASSVRAGLAAIDETAAPALGAHGSSAASAVAPSPSPSPSCALVLLTCDQPFIRAAFLDRLIQRQAETGRAMVAASHDGLPGVPALFTRTLFPRLRGLTGDQGARVLLREPGADVTLESEPDVAIDLDTPADYAPFDEHGARGRR